MVDEGKRGMGSVEGGGGRNEQGVCDEMILFQANTIKQSNN